MSQDKQFGTDLPTGFSYDGSFSPSGNVYYTQRVTKNKCASLCASKFGNCRFISWKRETATAQGKSWCYLSMSCERLVNTNTNGFDNASDKYTTYFISKTMRKFLSFLSSFLYFAT